jgi:NADH-quinone oxidoreductase subunit K|tara:strand:+ start:464 stop:760 length:297 start_codon:yes stop_codon:yes gene_type:complete
MLTKIYLCCFSLIIISITGILLNRKNIINTIICIEVMLLASTINFVAHSLYFDDILGQIYSFFIIALGAAESAMFLGILISLFRVRRSMTLHFVLLKH